MPSHYGFLSPARRNQVSFFPMLHEGKLRFDHMPFLRRMVTKGQIEATERETLAELHLG